MSGTFKFTGVNNVKDPLHLKAGEMPAALNVDCDNDGIASRRDGYSLALAGSPHSLWATEDESKAYFVESSELKQLQEDYTSSVLKSLVSNNPMAFCEVNHLQVFSNGIEIGLVENKAASAMSHTPGTYNIAMKPGNHLSFYNGQLYSSFGNVTHFSLPYDIETMDSRQCRILWPEPVKMQIEVDNGIWFSAGNRTYFLRGDGMDESSLEQKASYPAIPGTAVKAKAEHFGFQKIFGNVVLWASTQGVCLGTSDGHLINLSESRYSCPSGQSGAGLLRQQNGCVHYLAVTQDGGEQFNIYKPNPVTLDDRSIAGAVIVVNQ